MDSELLDVVIGIVFVWFLYSVVLSGLNEALTWATRTRAKHLWLGIGRLIDPKQSDLPRTFLDLAWKLPFGKKFELRPVAGEAASKDDLRGNLQKVYGALAPQIVEVAKPNRLTKTTHIAKEAFADAVISAAAEVSLDDLVPAAAKLGWTTEQVAALTKKVAAQKGADQDAEATLSRDLIAGWADSTLKKDLLISLYAEVANSLSVRDVVRFVQGNKALASAVDSAAAEVTQNERLQAVRTTVETWFDREMERVSAIYRRQSRKILAVFALVFVLVTHSNAVAQFQDLRHDDNLRQTLTNAALTTAAAADIDQALNAGVCADDTETGTDTDDRSPCSSDACRFTVATETPAPTTQTPTDPTAPPTPTTADPLTAAARQLDCTADLVDRLEQFRVGLAVTDLRQAHERSTGGDVAEADFHLNDVKPYVTDVIAADYGLLGRALAVIALSLGAQFWFDVLRRLVGIRKSLTRDSTAATG